MKNQSKTFKKLSDHFEENKIFYIMFLSSIYFIIAWSLTIGKLYTWLIIPLFPGAPVLTPKLCLLLSLIFLTFRNKNNSKQSSLSSAILEPFAVLIIGFFINLFF